MAILLVQGNKKVAQATSMILDNVPIAGNVLILVWGSYAWAPVQPPLTNVVQTGVTWVRAVFSQSNASSGINMFYTVDIWYGIVGAGALPTINITGAGGSYAWDVCEWSGLDLASLLDQTATSKNVLNTGTTALTTRTVELWIGGLGGNAADASLPTDGFTLLDGVVQNNECTCYLYKIVSAVGTAYTSVTALWNGNRCAGAIATFYGTLPAGGGRGKSKALKQLLLYT